MSVILCDRGDEYRVIEEEKGEWIRDVLLAIGIDKEMLGSDIDGMALKEYLDAREIEVWNNLTTGSVDISRKDKIIAQWKAPKLNLVKETPSKWYYEIRLDEWALPFQIRKRGEV